MLEKRIETASACESEEVDAFREISLETSEGEGVEGEGSGGRGGGEGGRESEWNAFIEEIFRGV